MQKNIMNKFVITITLSKYIQHSWLAPNLNIVVLLKIPVSHCQVWKSLAQNSRRGTSHSADPIAASNWCSSSWWVTSEGPTLPVVPTGERLRKFSDVPVFPCVCKGLRRTGRAGPLLGEWMTEPWGGIPSQCFEDAALLFCTWTHTFTWYGWVAVVVAIIIIPIITAMKII